MLNGWQGDLTAAWRTALDGVDLAYGDVADDLIHESWEPIFPSLKSQRILGEPDGAATLQAFAGMTPNQVRVVIIGQDPYPKVSQATGRAFEQGDVDDWAEDGHRVTKSMRRILQALADQRRGGPKRYSVRDSGWDLLQGDLQSFDTEIEGRRELFNNWASQGVLLINAGLTISRFGATNSRYQFEGHIPLWAPVVGQVMRFLSTRQSGQVVFVLWGGKARTTFNNSAAEHDAQAAGTWGSRAAKVERSHPAAPASGSSERPPFFSDGNPFSQINDALISLGADAIDW